MLLCDSPSCPFHAVLGSSKSASVTGFLLQACGVMHVQGKAVLKPEQKVVLELQPTVEPEVYIPHHQTLKTFSGK